MTVLGERDAREVRDLDRVDANAHGARDGEGPIDLGAQAGPVGQCAAHDHDVGRSALERAEQPLQIAQGLAASKQPLGVPVRLLRRSHGNVPVDPLRAAPLGRRRAGAAESGDALDVGAPAPDALEGLAQRFDRCAPIRVEPDARSERQRRDGHADLRRQPADELLGRRLQLPRFARLDRLAVDDEHDAADGACEGRRRVGCGGRRRDDQRSGRRRP